MPENTTISIAEARAALGMSGLPDKLVPLTAAFPDAAHEKTKYNYKHQLRDRHGRWIEMGGEVKWNLGGKSFTGKAVGFNGENVVVQTEGSKTPTLVDHNLVETVNAKASLPGRNETPGEPEFDMGTVNDHPGDAPNDARPIKSEAGDRTVGYVRKNETDKNYSAWDENGQLIGDRYISPAMAQSAAKSGNSGRASESGIKVGDQINSPDQLDQLPTGTRIRIGFNEGRGLFDKNEDGTWKSTEKPEAGDFPSSAFEKTIAHGGRVVDLPEQTKTSPATATLERTTAARPAHDSNGRTIGVGDPVIWSDSSGDHDGVISQATPGVIQVEEYGNNGQQLHKMSPGDVQLDAAPDEQLPEYREAPAPDVDPDAQKEPDPDTLDGEFPDTPSPAPKQAAEYDANATPSEPDDDLKTVKLLREELVQLNGLAKLERAKQDHPRSPREESQYNERVRALTDIRKEIANARASRASTPQATKAAGKITKTAEPKVDVSVISDRFRSTAPGAQGVQLDGESIGKIQPGKTGTSEMDGRVKTGRWFPDRSGYFAWDKDGNRLKTPTGGDLFDNQTAAIEALRAKHTPAAKAPGPEAPAAPKAPTQAGSLKPGTQIQVDENGVEHLTNDAGHKLTVGQRVRSTKDGSTGEIVKLENGGKGIHVKDANGKRLVRHKNTLEPADSTAAPVPEQTPEAPPTPDVPAAPRVLQEGDIAASADEIDALPEKSTIEIANPTYPNQPDFYNKTNGVWRSPDNPGALSADDFDHVARTGRVKVVHIPKGKQQKPAPSPAPAPVPTPAPEAPNASGEAFPRNENGVPQWLPDADGAHIEVGHTVTSTKDGATGVVKKLEKGGIGVQYTVVDPKTGARKTVARNKNTLKTSGASSAPTQSGTSAPAATPPPAPVPAEFRNPKTAVPSGITEPSWGSLRTPAQEADYKMSNANSLTPEQRKMLGETLERQFKITGARGAVGLRNVGSFNDDVSSVYRGGDVPFNVMGYTAGWGVSEYQTNFNDIYIHPDAWSSKMDMQVERGKDKGHHTPGHFHDAADYYTSHEFGHHLDNMILQKLPGDQRARFWRGIAQRLGITPGPVSTSDQRKALIQNNRAAISESISAYGATSPEELIAEIWAEYSTNGDKSRPHVYDIGQAIQAIIAGGSIPDGWGRPVQ